MCIFEPFDYITHLWMLKSYICDYLHSDRVDRVLSACYELDALNVKVERSAFYTFAFDVPVNTTVAS